MHGRTRYLGLLVAFLAFFAPAPVATAAEISTPNTCVAIFEGVGDAGGGDPKATISIAAARNGSFSGQVVVKAAATNTNPGFTFKMYPPVVLPIGLRAGKRGEYTIF